MTTISMTPGDSDGSPGDARLTGGVPPGPWSLVMADYALLLQQLNGTFREVADRVVAGAVKMLPSVTAAGFLHIDRHDVVTAMACTDPVVVALVEVEQHTTVGVAHAALAGDGPGKIVISERSGWPSQAQATLAKDLGICGCLTVRLSAKRVLGALLLLTSSPAGWQQATIDGVDLFATHSAVALEQAKDKQNIVAGVATRDVIGQAKGIIMERERLDADDAYQLLVHLSQQHNTPLRKLAEDVVATGFLPPSCRQHAHDHRVGIAGGEMRRSRSSP